MGSREDRLRNLYDFLKVDYADIIVRAEDVDIDFTKDSFISDQTITDYPELFFSKAEHARCYLQKFGTLKTVKLCETYGYDVRDFGIEFDYHNIFVRSHPISDEDLIFLMKKLTPDDKIDFQAILNHLVWDRFQYWSGLRFPLSEKFCITNGACVQLALNNLREKMKVYTKDHACHYIKCLVELKLDDLIMFSGENADDIDNKFIEIFATNARDVRDLIGVSETWLSSRELDYSNPLVVKFVLFVSSSNFDFFHRSLTKLMTHSFDADKYFDIIVECVDYLIRKTDCQPEDFFASFLPYIDFPKIFDDYLDGRAEINMEKTYWRNILKQLAIVKGLIKNCIQ
jgi:hypothetical protein